MSLIKTIKKDSYQSIKDTNGSLIVVRKSRINPSLYKYFLQLNSQNQSRLPLKTNNIKILDEPKPKVSNIMVEKMLNEYEDNRFSLTNELENPADKQDQGIQTSLIYPRVKTNYHKLRWVISFCDCMMQISKFFCMDSAQALQTYFQSGSLSLSSTQYNLFYSIFAYLFFLPFLSGYISDKLGVRVGLFIFCMIQTVGHIFFMFGGTFESFSLMLFGRFFFGIGALCVEVCEDVMITIWFFDKELTLALGLSFAACRAGTALTSIMTPQLIEISEGNYFLPMFVGTIFSLIGLFCCIVIIYVDRKYQKYIKHEFVDSFLEETSMIQNEMKLADIKSLGKMFWLIVLNCLFAYTCYFSFVDNGNDMLCTLYLFSPQKAGHWLTIVYLLSAIFTPLFGIIVDKVGRRVQLMLISLVLLIIPHIIFAFLPESSNKGWVVFSLIIIGFFFSIYGAVFWSCIPLVTEDKKQGIAFGTVYSTLNVVLVIASLFIGIIHDHTLWWRGGYQFCVLFMIFCLCISVYLAIEIRKLDESKGGILNSVVSNTEIRDKMNDGAENNENENFLKLIETKRAEFLEMKDIKS